MSVALARLFSPLQPPTAPRHYHGPWAVRGQARGDAPGTLHRIVSRTSWLRQGCWRSQETRPSSSAPTE